ncbi:hypothetical protein B14_200137 (plasmid) [Bacillus licheniformis]|uniref:hypothetical protein n=1 Tax=Bacillus licheniformis TaxID=1402 RepID=UPI0009B7BEE1|nr:hypothetical protein [Bacillus licheniformis]ARC67348.1 hypothetical protein B14_200137 [Bacillus licheniformis]MDE1421783.1 hypothetical protein [Bacillus licheniformis]MEC0475788.1 hypothetical protein [Bacillus licheniformis]
MFRVVFKEKRDDNVYTIKEGIEMEEMLKHLVKKEKYYLLKIYQSFDKLTYIKTLEYRDGEEVRLTPKPEQKPITQQRSFPDIKEIVFALGNAHPSRNDSFIDKLIDFLKGVDITKPKLTVASNNIEDDES